jgi:predicted ATP-binding protein involved in virulence
LYLAERYYRERQFDVAQLNDRLREDLVEYSFGDILSLSSLRVGKPWKAAETRKRRETILRGLSQAGIQVSQEVVSRYFESLEEIASQLEKQKVDPKNPPKAWVDWVINMPQLKKIERVIQRMEQYNKQRTDLFSRIDNFLSTVNGFLSDTGKVIKFDTSGEVFVDLGTEHRISADQLSSGESQLVILFAYLYFGSQPTREFTVMVDEPELSLHLDWQHRYVESALKANPDAQFIFATHAPEIAQGHDDRCIELSPKGVGRHAKV